MDPVTLMSSINPPVPDHPETAPEPRLKGELLEPPLLPPPPPPPPGPGIYLNGTIIDQNGSYIPCLLKLPNPGGTLGFSAIDNTFYVV